MEKVVVIEDDPEIQRLLEIHLTDLGCAVHAARRGDLGLELVGRMRPDLVILDIMMPGMDGIEVCQRIRAKELDVPILMLTARSEEIDKVLGLEMGADDYLTKPFSVRELLARIKAIFRRRRMDREQDSPESTKGVMRFDGLEVDLERSRVLVEGNPVDLSPKEFELLALLAAHPGKSFDRSQLLDLVWGYDFKGYEHTVNSHINRLRSKIEPDMGNPRFVLTKWGVGYKFNDAL